MSGADMNERDDDVLAGEYALGLLEGEELLAARGKEATDPEFEARKAWWERQLAPLLDQIAGMEPSADLWSRIEAQLYAETTSQGANVIDLTARLRRWQWTAGITSAAAAVMVAVMVFAPGSGPTTSSIAPPSEQIASAGPMVAQMPIGESGVRLNVTYLPDSDQLLVGAIDFAPDSETNDHELWLVLPDGSGVESLGLITPGEVVRRDLSEIAADNLGDGAQILLSQEPLGGKPEGADPGPILAQGEFSQV